MVPSKDVGLKHFRDARKIIFEQIQTERLYYPYRVAARIGDFYDTFAGAFAEPEKEELRNAANYIAKRIGGLPPALQQHQAVVLRGIIRSPLKLMRLYASMGRQRLLSGDR